jgi:hypothetical protein
MGDVDTRILSSWLSFPDGIAIESIYPTQASFILQVACAYPTAVCPLCQQPSARIHEHYRRLVEYHAQCKTSTSEANRTHLQVADAKYLVQWA